MKFIINLIMKYKPILILVIVPIGFTLIFGAAMSPTYVDEIPIAVLDMDDSPDSLAIIEDFQACSIFKIIERADSAEQIKEDILMGKIKGGLVLPDGFGKDITEKKGAKALMLIDGTNFLVGNNLKLYSYKIFNEKNMELQVSDMEEEGIVPDASNRYIDTLSMADRTLYNPQLGYFYYLYAGLLGIFVQQTYLNVLAPILLKEKDRLKLMPMERISRRIHAREMAPLIFQYAGLSFISLLSCLLIAHFLFTYPMNGSIILTLLLQMIFLAGLTGIAFVFAAIFDDVTHCTQFAMFMAIPSMLSCGYGWSEFMMAPGFANVMKLIWPLYYYYNPLKELMLKGSDFYALQNYYIGGILFAVFWLPAGMWMYRQKIRTMKQFESE
ncbi:MAG: ABC transporter permease [Bacillota bacterium]